jgi:hypothetical protein
MSEKIIEIIIEKGLLAIIISIVGFWFSKYLEIGKQNNLLKNKIIETNRDKMVSNVEKQLTQFYYPIYFKLQKDTALWQLSPQLSGVSGSLPQETNDLIEYEYILKNHFEIRSLIENNIHLIEIDDLLQQSINAYLKHITVYEILRKTKSLQKLNPINFDAPFPENFIALIKQKMMELQSKNNKLLSSN